MERALATQEAIYGEKHVVVARVLMNLGIAYGNLQEYELQRDLLECALTIQEKTYGKDHVAVARTLGNLGIAYGDLKQYQRQRDFLERALIIQERVYGKEHVLVARTLLNLGIAYGSLGNYKKKCELLERALCIAEAPSRHDPSLVSITLGNLAIGYHSLHKLEKALAIANRAYKLIVATPGFSTHPNTMKLEQIVQDMVIDYIEEIGEHEKDKDNTIWQFCLDFLKLKRQKADKNPFDIDLQLQTGDLLLAFQQVEEAIECYNNVVELAPATPSVYHNLACCHHIIGNLQEAENCFEAGIEHDLTAAILAEYAHFLYLRNNYDKALNQIGRCLAMPDDDMSSICYGKSEYHLLEEPLKKLLDEKGILTFSAIGLAYYLQVHCYDALGNEENCQVTVAAFSTWLQRQIAEKNNDQDLFDTLEFNTYTFELDNKEEVTSMSLDAPSVMIKDDKDDASEENDKMKTSKKEEAVAKVQTNVKAQQLGKSFSSILTPRSEAKIIDNCPDADVESTNETSQGSRNSL